MVIALEKSKDGGNRGRFNFRLNQQTDAKYPFSMKGANFPSKSHGFLWVNCG
jgi:hypothetical protein